MKTTPSRPWPLIGSRIRFTFKSLRHYFPGLLFALVLLCACGPMPTTTPDAGCAEPGSLRCTIEALPVCASGVELHDVSITPGFCTFKACGSATCCNRCAWTASMDITPLNLPDSPFECEIRAWNAVLAEYALNADVTCRSVGL